MEESGYQPAPAALHSEDAPSNYTKLEIGYAPENI
jgi:hypothetical protein